MIDLKMFDSTADLLELTGLSTEDELWDVGFNLDDWDVGFAVSERLTIERDDDDYLEEYGGNRSTGVCTYDGGTGSFWLVMRMFDYCVGYERVHYGDLYYYLVYHA